MGPLFIPNSTTQQQSPQQPGEPSPAKQVHSHNTYSQIEDHQEHHPHPPKLPLKRHTNHPSLSSSSTCDEFLINDPTYHHGHNQSYRHAYQKAMTNSCSSSNLRKYIVLLQDCVVIKFIPTTGQQLLHYQQQQQQFEQFNFNHNEAIISGTSQANLANQQSNNGVPTITTATSVASGGVGSDVDHLHGLHLYKSFREANLKCYWNTSMCEAIRSLEYKGYLVPSTILVYSPSPRHLNVLRTAWSRRILRYPAGYKVDLLGEIEEIVAQPVQQGQFAPLSDSLCWAILELTSGGQEAFVDSIMQALANAFPAMSNPPKELVYQTLEKLIREQKIYQTSHGYYIVTPEVSTFMNSRSVTPAPVDWIGNYFGSEIDKISISQHSWGSAASVLEAEDLLFNRRHSNPHGHTLKRHNSLKIIRQRDRDADVMPRMGARSLSFRLSKVNSLFDSDKEDDDEHNRDVSSNGVALKKNAESGMAASLNGTTDGTKKRRSFFRRWFSFRRLKTPKPIQPMASISPPLPKSSLPPPLPTQMIPKAPHRNTSSSSTQTISKSNENLVHILAQNASRITSPTCKWNSLPSSTRQARKSLLHEDSPFYDDLIGANRVSRRATPTIATQVPVPPTSTQLHHRRRHLSGGGSGGAVNRAASPCPSNISAIYAQIPGNTAQERVYPRVFQHYSKYAQQHPPPVGRTRNHHHQRPRPRSAYEIYNYQHQLQKEMMQSTTTTTSRLKEKIVKLDNEKRTTATTTKTSSIAVNKPISVGISDEAIIKNRVEEQVVNNDFGNNEDNDDHDSTRESSDVSH